ncbi:MAG: L-histidine N(alpha)-methyltransferase [Acidobacteriota bacterium]
MTGRNTGCPRVSLTTLRGGSDAAERMARELCESLAREPREIPSKYFYDERGALLFEQITTLPEYYPTRAETGILERHASDLVEAVEPEEVVELGAGYSRKTRLLLEAAMRRRPALRFAALDVTPEALEDAGRALTTAFPGLRYDGYVGDFERDVDRIPRTGRRLLVFLGSTIGNLDPAARAAFLGHVHEALAAGDGFLLGVDLVKDRRVLEDAYNDSRGVTAAFNLNALAVLNDRLGGDFDLDGFEHVAFWNERESRIEMWVRAKRPMTVRLAAAEFAFDLEAGEQIRTEISCKFTRAGIAGELERAGLALDTWHTDPGDRFALLLARRTDA